MKRYALALLLPLALLAAQPAQQTAEPAIVLGAASTALVFGLLRALRKKECRSDARSSMAPRAM